MLPRSWEQGLVEYLEEVGGADIGESDEGIPAEEQKQILGTYIYGAADDERIQPGQTTDDRRCHCFTHDSGRENLSKWLERGVSGVSDVFSLHAGCRRISLRRFGARASRFRFRCESSRTFPLSNGSGVWSPTLPSIYPES